MHKIIHKQVIAEGIKKIDIAAPLIAAKALPGQFVMVTPVLGEHNIPMTIIDSDERRSMVSLLVHEVGSSTRKLGELSIGESLYQMVGPLGRGAQMDKYGLVICVATGIGAAQILPICRGLKKKGNKVIGIIGAKSKKVLMLESQMRVVCDEIFITTNDGSYERKGLATGLLKELLNKYTVQRVYAIGAVEMMQAAAQMTKEKNIPLRVTLSPYMVNGLGLCGSCRVKIDGRHRLACVDGPEFDGHMVDYNDLSQRMNALESHSWGNQTHPVSQKRPGFTNFREVSLGLVKKITQDEARRCPQCAVATCLPGCPLGIDIPGFIRLLREGDTVLALERIKKENPFPAICGRICPAPCEDACVFNADGEPIAIRALERFAADFGSPKPEKTPAAPRDKKVAIIGSGPAGMSAAYYLAKMNISVTIFEAAHQPGGLLRYAVPEFRLPQKILDEQFAQLKLLGVQIQTDVVFGRTMMVDEIFMRGFSAVLLATGASLPRFSELPGSDLTGVYYDVEFLSRLQTVNKENPSRSALQQMIPTAKTVIIGRGQAAFDAARLALRLGSETHVVFEGFEEQAGVGDDILRESKEEGVETHSMQVIGMVGDDHGFVRGVKCHKLDIVEAKEGLKLEPSSDEPVVLEAQTVIIANGQVPNDFLKQYLPQLKWDEDGSLWADGQSGMTSLEKVFACGSVVTAGGAVVDAIAGGKIAAQKIIQYLQ